MRVPYKPTYLTKAYKRFNYIVIHDFSCRFAALDKAKIDDKKFTTGAIRDYNWAFNNEFELPYHFICEKVGTDYETIMSMPLSFYCEYKDIPDQYVNSVHIAIAGTSIQQIEARAYMQMGYRSIASIMRWFAIPISNIKMHWEVTTDENLHCPGDAFHKDKLLALINQLILIKR